MKNAISVLLLTTLQNKIIQEEAHAEAQRRGVFNVYSLISKNYEVRINKSIEENIEKAKE